MFLLSTSLFVFGRDGLFLPRSHPSVILLILGHKMLEVSDILFSSLVWRGWAPFSPNKTHLSVEILRELDEVEEEEPPLRRQPRPGAPVGWGCHPPPLRAPFRRHPRPCQNFLSDLVWYENFAEMLKSENHKVKAVVAVCVHFAVWVKWFDREREPCCHGHLLLPAFRYTISRKRWLSTLNHLAGNAPIYLVSLFSALNLICFKLLVSWVTLIDRWNAWCRRVAQCLYGLFLYLSLLPGVASAVKETGKQDV